MKHIYNVSYIRIHSVVLYSFLVLTDPPGGKTIDHTSVDEFRDLLNLNLVNYFIFCKVSVSGILLHHQ